MLKTMQRIKTIAFLLSLMPVLAFSMDAELPVEVMQSVADLNAITIPSYQELQQDKTLFLKTESLLAKASVLGIKKRIEDALSEEESKIEHLSPKAKIKIKISILLKIQRIASYAVSDAARCAASNAAYSNASSTVSSDYYFEYSAASYADSAIASDATSYQAFSVASYAASYSAYSAARDNAARDTARADATNAASYSAYSAAKEIKWNTLTFEERKAAGEYMALISIKDVQSYIILNNYWFKNIITTTVDSHLENPPKEGWDTFKIKRKGINNLFSRIENKKEKDISLYFAPYIPLWNEIYCTNKKTAILLLGIQKSRMTYEKRSILNKDIMQIIAKKAKNRDEENI